MNALDTLALAVLHCDNEMFPNLPEEARAALVAVTLVVGAARELDDLAEHFRNQVRTLELRDDDRYLTTLHEMLQRVEETFAT